METVVQLNSGAKLSPHFTLGEMTKSSSHPEVYNIPSHEAIENLKRVCTWLEELRKRYNERYVQTIFPPKLGGTQRGLNKLHDQTTPGPSYSGGEMNSEVPTSGGEMPIIINSGYRSPQLNRKIGGVATSNHLTGCAVDIRVDGMEQLIVYAAILLDISKDWQQEFDELLIEKNRYGAIWLHFAVRASGNRRKVLFINA